MEIWLPRPWPVPASKFDVSTRTSWIMSALGDVPSWRLTPALVAPSIVYVLLPTPPIDVPAALLGPLTKPCDIGGWSGAGFTPGANRTRLMGMFENIGSASTSLESKFALDVTDVVSRSGASAVTMTDSEIWPTSRLNERDTCWAT